MRQDAELDNLKAEHDRAYQRKQDAWQAQDQAWNRRSTAREAMDRAHHEKQGAYDEQDSSWQEYQRVRSYNGPRIDDLNARQEAAFQNMKDAFENASSAHEARDGASARMYADDGHRYKAEAQDAVAERRQLVQEIRDARERHEATKPAFQRAKAEFDHAKIEHNRAKTEYERAQDEFKRAKVDFDRAKEAFQQRLAAVRTERKQRKDDKRSLAERAGVPYQYLDDVWVSTEPDGTVNIYFGGVGSPEGPGHGHYAMDAYGNVTYQREPSDPHGAHNFADYEERPDTAFGESVRKRDGRTQYFFNRGKEDGSDHGHVVETTNADGSRTYHYVRDREGNVYIDDND